MPEPEPISQNLLLTRPWRASSFGQTADIDAYHPATGTWETIATVNAMGSFDAEELAAFMVQKVNES